MQIDNFFILIIIIIANNKNILEKSLTIQI